MIRGFYLPDYMPKKQIVKCNYPSEELPELSFEAIKITPSKSLMSPLSERAIPYYYPVGDFENSMHHFWNYEHSKNSSTDHIQGYYINKHLDSYTDNPLLVLQLFTVTSNLGFVLSGISIFSNSDSQGSITISLVI